MPHYILSCYDKPNSLQLRLDTRPAHLDYLNGSPLVKLAGPILGADEKPIGSMIILEAENEAAVDQFCQCDPYQIAGLFDRKTVEPYILAINNLKD